VSAQEQRFWKIHAIADRDGARKLTGFSFLPYNDVMKTPTVCQTFRALGVPIGILLAVSLSGSVIAQDQRGTDTLPLVVKTIPDQKFIVATDWTMVTVVGIVGFFQIVIFITQGYLLWETVISSNLPKIIVRRIVIESPNIDNRPVTQPFRKRDKLCGRFTFINVGRRKATIAETYSMFFITDRALPMTEPYIGATENYLDITLSPGWSDRTPIMKSITIDDIPNDPHWKLYVMGWIDCIYIPPFLRWLRRRSIRRRSLRRSVSRVFFFAVSGVLASPALYR
jgi:hypothetical protein